MSMSDRLKSTLGLMEDIGVEVREYEEDSEYAGMQGTEIVPFIPKEVVSSLADVEDSDIKNDYIMARNVTYTLFEMAGSAMEGSLKVATETQHPKAYGVFNELATTMRGLTKDLMEMQRTFREIESAKTPSIKGNITQNNFNVQTVSTSMADVLKALKEEKKNTDGEDIVDV